jgi:beta-lactamase class A
MPVANKTGSLTGIDHDAAIVYPPGRKPYVLIVLTRGIADQDRARNLIADISRAIFRFERGADHGLERAVPCANR